MPQASAISSRDTRSPEEAKSCAAVARISLLRAPEAGIGDDRSHRTFAAVALGWDIRRAENCLANSKHSPTHRESSRGLRRPVAAGRWRKLWWNDASVHSAG